MSCFLLLLFLSDIPLQPSKLAHTYSIVAYDPQTGEVGGAVQSHWFAVSDVIWVEAGVGAVATQSLTRLDYGPLGLQGMATGKSPKQVMEALRQADEGRDLRQVGMVNARGDVANFSGKRCIDKVCDLQGKGYAIQANIMTEDGVCAEMEKAFLQTKGPLAERLLAALNAAQAAGGDLRGKQSAALKVVSAAKPEKPWLGTVVDLRVADHTEPLKELSRLYGVHKAYQYMEAGDHALEKEDVVAALAAYSKTFEMLPGRVEPMFWQAINLVEINRLDEALPLFKKVFHADPNWVRLPKRLVKSGFLSADPKILAAIMDQAPAAKSSKSNDP